MEARQELIDELDEQHALFALEAPAHAAALWTIGQIEAFYESEGELLGPEPEDPVPRPLPLLTHVPCVLLLLCCYPCDCDSVAVLSAASSGDPGAVLSHAWPSTLLASTALPPVLTDVSSAFAAAASFPCRRRCCCCCCVLYLCCYCVRYLCCCRAHCSALPHHPPTRQPCRFVICVFCCCVLSVPLLLRPLLVLLLCPLPLLLPRPLLSTTPPSAHPTAVSMCHLRFLLLRPFRAAVLPRPLLHHPPTRPPCRCVSLLRCAGRISR